MRISAEDLRRQYADLSDEALLEVDRQDLVELARNCYDEELARRNLKTTSARPYDPDEFVVAATFASQEEAERARVQMIREGIQSDLGSSGMTLLVRAALLEDARDLLEAQIPEEQLAEAAASASYVRHGVGTVRPYLYGNLDLVDFVQEVFGAVELERTELGPSSFHIEAAIGDSVLVLEVSDPPHKTAAPASVYVYVPDVDAAYYRAIQAGAADVSAPADKPYNERAAGVRDRSGNTWWIATYGE
jgi:PhnB protein